jgi:hypothetical protein
MDTTDTLAEIKSGEIELDSEKTNSPFPFILFSAAAFKDVLDALDTTGFGILLTTTLSLLIAVVLYIWAMSHLGIGGARATKRTAIRIASTIIIEFIPFVKIIPATSVFVYMTWRGMSRKEK